MIIHLWDVIPHDQGLLDLNVMNKVTQQMYYIIRAFITVHCDILFFLYFFFFRSGFRGPRAYSLLGGVVPSQSIG